MLSYIYTHKQTRMKSTVPQVVDYEKRDERHAEPSSLLHC